MPPVSGYNLFMVIIKTLLSVSIATAKFYAWIATWNVEIFHVTKYTDYHGDHYCIHANFK